MSKTAKTPQFDYFWFWPKFVKIGVLQKKSKSWFIGDRYKKIDSIVWKNGGTRFAGYIHLKASKLGYIFVSGWVFRVLIADGSFGFRLQTSMGKFPTLRKLVLDVPSALTVLVAKPVAQHLNVPVAKHIDVPVAKHLDFQVAKHLDVPVAKHLDVLVVKPLDVHVAKHLDVLVAKHKLVLFLSICVCRVTSSVVIQSSRIHRIKFDQGRLKEIFRVLLNAM